MIEKFHTISMHSGAMLRYTLILLLNYFVQGETSAKDVCHARVESELKDVINTHQTPPNFSLPLNSFDNVNDLLRKLQRIQSGIENLTNVTRLQNAIERKIDDIQSRIPKTDTMDLLKAIAHERALFRSGKNATIEECETAQKNYANLKEDFSEIVHLGKKMAATHDAVVEKLDETNTKSLNIKKDIDDILVPDTFSCSEELWKTLDGIAHVSLKIKSALMKLGEIILKKLKYLSDVMGEIKIPDVENETPLVMGSRSSEELKNEINRLNGSINELKESLGKLDELNDIIEELKRGIRNGENILKKFENYKNDDVMKKLEKMKTIAGNICRMGVCKVSRLVSVED